MEMQENDLPDSAPFLIKGFPTIKFKPAGSRTFVDYNRLRTLKDFVAFAEEHAGNSLEFPGVESVVHGEAEVAQAALGEAR